MPVKAVAKVKAKAAPVKKAAPAKNSDDDSDDSGASGQFKFL